MTLRSDDRIRASYENIPYTRTLADAEAEIIDLNERLTIAWHYLDEKDKYIRTLEDQLNARA